ncbi:MAG: DNA polymerase III subunit beta [Alicyclobacillus sp.]|nr:DNA polymerase III subunit beta [Alicyclobacillus sp.]
MHFVIQQSTLLRLLQVVSKAVAVRTTKPVLTGILLTAAERQLTATAYNLDLGIQDTVDADDENHLNVFAPGSIVLPARYFTDVIRKLPNADLTISVSNNYITNIECGSIQFHLHGIDAAEFPTLPSFHPISTVQFSSTTLRDFIQSTAFAVSTSEVRPLLTGIYVQLKDSHITFTATDGLRLATRSATFENLDGSWSAVIPGKSMADLARTLPDDPSVTIPMQITSSHCLFIIGKTQFYTRLLDGAYPDTSRIIPTTTRTSVTVDAKRFGDAIDRAALIARDRDSHMVKLDLRSGLLTLSSSSPEIGNVSEQLEVDAATGDDIQIAFNARYVLDALSAFASGPVDVRFNGSNQPFTLQRPDEEGALQLISPVLMR